MNRIDDASSTSAPLVSVIIAAFRSPEYLNEALESLARQSFASFEVIVVDDGSGDDCVRRYRLPPNARLIRRERNGGSAAITRNTGLRSARGAYVAFLDQDDVWLPGTLGALVQAIESSPAPAMVHCGCVAVDAALRPLERRWSPPRVPRDPVRALLERNFITTPSSALIRRAAMESCGAFDESIFGAADRDLWLRLALHSRIVALQEPLVLYRTHPDQLHLRETATRAGRVRFHEKTLAWAERERPELARVARRAYAHLLRKIALLQMNEESLPDEALRTLLRARQLCTWDLRTQLLLLRARRAVRNRAGAREGALS